MYGCTRCSGKGGIHCGERQVITATGPQVRETTYKDDVIAMDECDGMVLLFES